MNRESPVQTELFTEETLLGTGDKVIQRLFYGIYITVRKIVTKPINKNIIWLQHGLQHGLICKISDLFSVYCLMN